MSIKKVWIIGAGGCGRETLILARGMRESGWQWVVEGFLDSRPHMLDGYGADLRIEGDPSIHVPQEDELFICAQGHIEARRHYAEIIERQGGHFLSVIPRDLYIPPSTRIGNGCVLSTGIIVGPDMDIGDHVHIQSLTVFGHDVQIGRYCQIGAMTVIGGGVCIGENVTVHPHATILPGIKVGDGAIIGAGAVVLKDVPAASTVFGNPARIIFSHQKNEL